jgi:hypothetical protein
MSSVSQEISTPEKTRQFLNCQSYSISSIRPWPLDYWSILTAVAFARSDSILEAGNLGVRCCCVIFESTIVRHALHVLELPVVVSGVFKFSQSYSDRVMRHDKSHTHFLHVQFHQGNYLWDRPVFASAGKHWHSRLRFELRLQR